MFASLVSHVWASIPWTTEGEPPCAQKALSYRSSSHSGWCLLNQSWFFSSAHPVAGMWTRIFGSWQVLYSATTLLGLSMEEKLMEKFRMPKYVSSLWICQRCYPVRFGDFSVFALPFGASVMLLIWKTKFGFVWFIFFFLIGEKHNSQMRGKALSILFYNCMVVLAFKLPPRKYRSCPSFSLACLQPSSVSPQVSSGRLNLWRGQRKSQCWPTGRFVSTDLEISLTSSPECSCFFV